MPTIMAIAARVRHLQHVPVVCSLFYLRSLPRSVCTTLSSTAPSIFSIRGRATERWVLRQDGVAPPISSCANQAETHTFLFLTMHPRYHFPHQLSCVHCSVSDTSKGSHYINWGRRDCPSGDTRVTVGRAVGTWYQHSGSSSAPVCLESGGKFLTTNSAAGNGAFVYRAEIQTSESGDEELKKYHDQDSGCAICRRPPARSDAFVHPGSKSCPDGFKLDYWGFLVAERNNHNKGSFTCLNHEIASFGQTGNQNGYLMYPSEAQPDRGGELRNYKDYWELTCSVCSGTRNFWGSSIESAGATPPIGVVLLPWLPCLACSAGGCSGCHDLLLGHLMSFLRPRT